MLLGRVYGALLDIVQFSDSPLSSTQTIHTYPNNFRVHKALIAAAYTGETITETPVEMGKSNKTPEFLKLNPFGKVPTLEDGEVGIFEGNAIARYVAAKAPSAGLLGGSVVETARIEAFLCAELSFDNQISVVTGMIHGYVPKDQGVANLILTKVLPSFLAGIDLALSGSEWLVGDSLTLADIVVFAQIKRLFESLVDEEGRKPYTNVARWFTAIAGLEKVSKVVGDVKFCTEAAKVE